MYIYYLLGFKLFGDLDIMEKVEKRKHFIYISKNKKRDIFFDF